MSTDDIINMTRVVELWSMLTKDLSLSKLIFQMVLWNVGELIILYPLKCPCKCNYNVSNVI